MRGLLVAVVLAGCGGGGIAGDDVDDGGADATASCAYGDAPSCWDCGGEGAATTCIQSGPSHPYRSDNVECVEDAGVVTCTGIGFMPEWEAAGWYCMHVDEWGDPTGTSLRWRCEIDVPAPDEGAWECESNGGVRVCRPYTETD